MFCAAFRRFVVWGERVGRFRSLNQSKVKFPRSSYCRSGSKFFGHIDFVREVQFISSKNMSPRGKAKAKKEVGENGAERKTPVRQSRTVKAASYKDLSDSEDDKPIKKRKQDSDFESLSEDEKPKSKAKGRGRQPRAKKNVSESEEGSEFVSSDESSEGESGRKRRQPARQPARSLRAQRGPSYKDLSDSEEDFDGASKSSSDQEEEVKKRKEPAGSRKRGRPAKGASKASKEKSDASGSDGENDDEEKAAAEKKSDEEDADEKVNEDSKVKEDLKDDPEEKDSSKTDVTSNKADKKPRSEHDLSEEDEDGEGAEDEGSEDEDTHKESNDSKKRGRPEKSGGEKKPPAKKAKVEDKPKMNKTDTDYASIDFSSNSKTEGGEPWNLKISSWNVAGLRTWIQKGGLDFIKYENPDILCLQETKCSEKKLPPEAKVEGYESYWLSGEKEGYAGVALLSKVKPLNVEYGLGNPEFDTEGRVITAEFEKFYLVTAYVVNAGQGLKTLSKRLEWDPVFRAHLKKLDEKKPVILCGDLNVAHSEIDLANPKTNTKSAGFTPQEREGMTELLKEGFVDTFRKLYPDKKDAYSFWTYMSNARSRNVGWRLDYFITSERFLPNVCDNVIRSEVYGSDHCPITFFVRV